jgi:hypothetical protein
VKQNSNPKRDCDFQIRNVTSMQIKIMMQHHDIMMNHDISWALAMSGIQQGKSEIMITEINVAFKSAT